MSDIVLEYYSDVKEGNLQKNVRQNIAKELPHFEGKRVHIIIKKLKSQRSIQQNRLWWLYMKILAKELGYSKDEMHEIAKFKLLQREKINEKTGEVLPYLASTAKLSKSDFMDLITDLIRWAAEFFKVVLPLPNEQTDLL